MEKKNKTLEEPTLISSKTFACTKIFKLYIYIYELRPQRFKLLSQESEIFLSTRLQVLISSCV